MIGGKCAPRGRTASCDEKACNKSAEGVSASSQLRKFSATGNSAPLSGRSTRDALRLTSVKTMALGLPACAHMRRRSLLLGIAGLGAVAGFGIGWNAFAADIRRARARLRGRSRVIQGRFGDARSCAPECMVMKIAGGQRGIRTLGRLAPTHAFQACAFNHSATCPSGGPRYGGARRPAQQQAA
jgi:hypothetical protein